MEREEIVAFDLKPALNLLQNFEKFLSFYPDGIRGMVMDHFKYFCTYYVTASMKDSLGFDVVGAYEWDEVIEQRIRERYQKTDEWQRSQLAYPSVNHEDTLGWITTELVVLFHNQYAPEIDVLGSEVLNHSKMEWCGTFIGIPLHPKQSWNRPAPKLLY